MQTNDHEWTEFYTLDLENRRRARRVNRQIDIRYVTNGDGVRSSVALNVSATGARLILEGADVPRDTEMTLQLADRVDVLARTVWQTPLPGGKRVVAGVTFEAVNATQKLALADLLRSLEAA